MLARTELSAGLAPTSAVQVVGSRFRPAYGIIGSGTGGPIHGHASLPRDLGRFPSVRLTEVTA